VISGTEGHAIGLATHLADDPLGAAFALAHEIAGRSPEAVRGAKLLLNRLAVAGAAEQFAAEREVIFQLIGSPNQAEAVMAHFEKRAPQFNDAGLFR
jgi:enoyl-CoA hydratase/carnithine racemase